MPLFVKILPRLSDGSGTATFAEQIAGPASSLTKEPLRQRGVARGAEDVWAAGVGPECRQSGRPTCALLQRDSYRQAEDPFVVSLCRSPGTKSDGPSLLAESASRRPPLSYLFRGPSPRKPPAVGGCCPTARTSRVCAEGVHDCADLLLVHSLGRLVGDRVMRSRPLAWCKPEIRWSLPACRCGLRKSTRRQVAAE
jgi:hypothetical protein